MMRRLHDETGSALVTALIATILMLGLGFALLAIVDTQADQSAQERTRDQGFNLSESVLNSEAFVLGRNWPQTGEALACGAAGAGFNDTIRAAAPPTSDAAGRLRNNLDASYTDAIYDGAEWQVNICDDDENTTVWDESLLATSNAFDQNDNDKLWVRAQSTVGGKTRVLVGLVEVSDTPAVDPRYGLVAGNLSQDLDSTAGTVTNIPLAAGVLGDLLGTSPAVAPDEPEYPVPDSGVTGVRCGLLDQLNELKTCLTGTLGALSDIPLIDGLVTGGSLNQYPSTTSTSANTIGQLRTKAQDAPNEYIAAPVDGGPRGSAPQCNISAPSAEDTIVFIEQVGNGDQYCVLDVRESVEYEALVIGSGRVIIRGNGDITDYDNEDVNRFTGVIYALNLQTADQAASTPTRELVRIDQGARVRGAVHADGRNATVGLIPPPFDTQALLDELVCGIPLVGGLLCRLLSGLGVDGLLDGILDRVPLATVITSITSQLSGYGSAIHSDVAIIERFEVFGASGVTPGTFRDLAAR